MSAACYGPNYRNWERTTGEGAPSLTVCSRTPRPASAVASPGPVPGSWGKTTRDAVRNKERWKRSRAPSQYASTNADGQTRTAVSFLAVGATPARSPTPDIKRHVLQNGMRTHSHAVRARMHSSHPSPTHPSQAGAVNVYARTVCVLAGASCRVCRGATRVVTRPRGAGDQHVIILVQNEGRHDQETCDKPGT